MLRVPGAVRAAHSGEADIKVLLASETYPPDANGAAYFTQRLARGLTEADHDVHVACPRAPGGGAITLRDEAVVHGAPSMQVPSYPHLRFSPRSRGWARATIRIVKPELVHIQNHFCVGRSMAKAARDAGIPFVATNHFVPENFTVHVDYLPRPFTSALTTLLWRDLARVYDRATCITTPTPYAAELIREHRVASSATAISCGVDLARFRPRPADRRGLALFGIADRPTCLVVGRLDRDKRIDEVIGALASVHEELDVQLVIVGQGKDLARLRRVAEAAGVAQSVAFTGFVEDPDLPAVYAAADVYVNAGIAELQSISTLEAMACGKPVVAANAMALPHLVRNGVNGYTFESGDISSLAARLGKLLGDPARRARMGKESRAIAVEHDTRDTVGAYEALYRQVLATAAVRAPRSDRRPDRCRGTQLLTGSTGDRVARESLSLAPVLTEQRGDDRPPTLVFEALMRCRAALLAGLLGIVAALGIAAVPINSDFRPSLSWEWALYAALVPVAAMLAVWLMRRAAEDVKAGWSLLAAPGGNSRERSARSR